MTAIATLNQKELVKEQAVHDHRHWVRIAAACNNRCTFCLDSDAQNGTLVEDALIRKEILRGREDLHANRLILSGGEASINSKFPDYIRYGKELGYTKIQTVTNGRMYSYQKFCDKVLEAGLDEVTFSLHGHTPELHDTLVGIKGAFVQLVKGIINLMGKCIVNVDIVLNKQNYKHVHEIVAFANKLGVHEFDLLHITPFGRAYPANKDFLLYNVDHAIPYLRKVFELADQSKLFIWTNRFPVHHLEGFERLIQDPHKLFDEINGRRFMFRDYLKNSNLMPCHGGRCQYCFLDKYCQKLIEQKEKIEEADQIHLQVDADKAQEQLPRLAGYACDVFEWISPDVEALKGLSIPEDFANTDLRIDLKLGTGIAEFLGSRPEWKVKRLTVHDVAGLTEALSVPVIEVEVKLNGVLKTYLEENPTVLEENKTRLILSLEQFETLGEVNDFGLDAKSYFKNLAVDLEGVQTDLPACYVGPKAKREKAASVTHAEMLLDDGTLNIDAFTHDYIVNKYRAKSMRCQKCAFVDECDGMQIQYIRQFGFKQMQPIQA